MIILSEEEYNELKKSRDSWRDCYYEVRYALRKDEQLDESISCVRDIPSDVDVIEDLKKRAADSDYYKEMSELLEEKLKKANELADHWKRDYERLRDQFLCPIYNILYPDNPNLDINVTDLLNTIKDFKVYADENGRMYKEIQEWREKCIARGNEIDHLLSENKGLNQTISDQEVTIKALLITIKEMCKEDETNE
jgi:sugar-specific transcriptional regulator TrmB